MHLINNLIVNIMYLLEKYVQIIQFQNYWAEYVTVFRLYFDFSAATQT